MPENDKPIANPLVVLREEFDDWAILFDPDSGNGFGMNPVGVLIWKCLDGRHCLQDILHAIQEGCPDAPEETADHLREFIGQLVEHGLAGYEIQKD